ARPRPPTSLWLPRASTASTSWCHRAPTSIPKTPATCHPRWRPRGAAAGGSAAAAEESRRPRPRGRSRLVGTGRRRRATPPHLDGGGGRGRAGRPRRRAHPRCPGPAPRDAGGPARPPGRGPRLLLLVPAVVAGGAGMAGRPHGLVGRRGGGRSLAGALRATVLGAARQAPPGSRHQPPRPAGHGGGGAGHGWVPPFVHLPDRRSGGGGHEIGRA